MKYAFGASFNCVVGQDDEVGGGREGCSDIAYVSNDKQKLIDAVVSVEPWDKSAPPTNYIAKTDHEFVGKLTNVGEGKIVAVIGQDEDDDFYVVAVVFEEAILPTVIE